ncbi:RNA polymerase sigma factor [Tepiditoga spiralis]|uniref:RNA polymerase sigma factor n=1 Tax=Tepiditoga spiralis TaxID=2108365 RepID=A0A7G1G315_9BACT|nr:sigma-70 family RNA polymerase sigma factor [Tepiditoga spiralis]BBE30778.1 RNA polymerase sigma factor [Tepiditoga spiralis]
MKNEEKFINKLKNKDKIAYNELYEKYTKKISGVLSHYVRQSEMDDAVQEVFLKIFKGIHNFKGESKLSTWIYRISVNVGKNYLKKYKNEKIQSMDLENDEKNTYFYQPISKINVSERIISELNYELILKIINKLKPDEKTLIMLREIEKISYKDIAHIMNIPIGTVKSRIFYTRKKLKNLLEKEKY